MASNASRVQTRNRTGAQRVKADENAISGHPRQPGPVLGPSNKGTVHSRGASFAYSVVNGIRNGLSRPVLNEVTTAALNRKNVINKPVNKGKVAPEPTHKRTHSVASITSIIPPPSNVAQRIPLKPFRQQIQPPPPAATVTTFARARGIVPRLQSHARRISRAPPPEPEPEPAETVSSGEEEELDDRVTLGSSGMEVSDDVLDNVSEEGSSVMGEDKEVEALVNADGKGKPKTSPSPIRPKAWPEFDTECAIRSKKTVDAIREVFDDDVDPYQPTMASEYCDEVFEYMGQLEESVMPSPDYMDKQVEITWEMRQTLVDWLLQVHLRYHLLPETLWIAVNILDRFLSQRIVSLVKFQLLGVIAMFIASKYEEILSPSIEEFVYMTENGYTKEEILKGERIVLQTLDFKVSHYCSPYSWIRKISKADNYAVNTRILCKFLTEVTLLDWRFLRAKPSIVAAVGMFTARKMLSADWDEAFIFYSGYTREQLLPGYQMLLEKLVEKDFHTQYVCKKYAHKKFMKASLFAIEWAFAEFEDNSDSPASEMMSEG